MAFNASFELLKLLDDLVDTCDIPLDKIKLLLGYAKSIYKLDLEDSYSKPMLWIGLYIALASLVCILAMVADLLHGLRSRQLWFPCKYFRINAVLLTVISVAMKLPVDLSGSMLGVVDQAAKLGSMAFMCIMMANLLPCLATMDSNELLSNMAALCVLVITLVVNVCIQLQTGVVTGKGDHGSKIVLFSYDFLEAPGLKGRSTSIILAIIYVTLLLVMLILHVCSSLAILKSKQIIEVKYQKSHDTASEDIQQSPGKLLTVEKLQKHVRNHWIMATSGSPQFITACSPTSSASGVICVLITVLHTLTMYGCIDAMKNKDYKSDYKWSMMVILVVQSTGVVIGTISAVSRCFVILSFKVSFKIISNQFKVFKVESYWTWKLYDWKHGSIHEFRSRNLEVVIETLKRLILNFCIGFQNGVVVVCKVIALISLFFMVCVVYCFRCMKWLLKAMFRSSGEEFKKLGRNNDLSGYVLKLEDETELAERTLEGLLKSVNQLVQKGAKSQPNNLMKLLQKSTKNFQGVKQFESFDHDVPSKVELYQDCWRLPVVTLTTIAVSLPRIKREEVDSLLESVREGLLYITVVEKCLNATNELVSSQKTAETLWREVIFDKKWLGNALQDLASQVNTTDQQIVEWFRDKAKNMSQKDIIEGPNDDPISRSICVNSMYRITETILLTCHTNTDVTDSQEKLFNSLSTMIADIIEACLSNLPEVITMKCHTSVIEKREDSVKDAARLLGETTQIIETLQDRDIPSMNPRDMPFIDKWRAYKESIIP
ncbi:hypothetical protein L1987_85482 [Smallanthus sonchifolius]|uniref:Uncharacterized protein n=1 Tax=Smallanthus sonchifolius TaxID=185202 RepID=A0ACB8XWV2_9ASTR|nr:hypothetical protein L1987_85482 [Smallanthus sonchifolius]